MIKFAKTNSKQKTVTITADNIAPGTTFRGQIMGSTKYKPSTIFMMVNPCDAVPGDVIVDLSTGIGFRSKNTSGWTTILNYEEVDVEVSKVTVI